VYKLRYTEAAEAVWDSLPEQAREEFERAIAAACEDPWARTKPRDGDDPRDVRRLLVLRHTVTC
jgi:mRNA-degrading endonuclease RelE of RelBE toxin-antitoxin system